MINNVLAIVVIAESLQLLWLGVITAAWVAHRRRHDRLMSRVNALSKSITKTSRTRHTTGSHPAVSADGTRVSNLKPPPPFPVPPPSTNPISSAAGRHSAQ